MCGPLYFSHSPSYAPPISSSRHAWCRLHRTVPRIRIPSSLFFRVFFSALCSGSVLPWGILHYPRIIKVFLRSVFTVTHVTCRADGVFTLTGCLRSLDLFVLEI
jgi:hypothetical protein